MMYSEHEWFKSYLSDKQQFTVVASAHSGLAKIICGVSQGSVLRPLAIWYFYHIKEALTSI
jgi:hypothetical protein